MQQEKPNLSRARQRHIILLLLGRVANSFVSSCQSWEGPIRTCSFTSSRPLGAIKWLGGLINDACGACAEDLAPPTSAESSEGKPSNGDPSVEPSVN